MKKIEIDTDPLDPREDYDHLATFWGWHRRYRSPDSDAPRDPVPIPDTAVGLPVYMYDHSSIALNCTGFSCPWDSGQFGIIFVEKERLRAEFGWKVITPKRRAQVHKWLEAEVQEWENFCNGNVYVVDGVSGYYGYDAALEAAA